MFGAIPTLVSKLREFYSEVLSDEERALVVYAAIYLAASLVGSWTRALGFEQERRRMEERQLIVDSVLAHVQGGSLA